VVCGGIVVENDTDFVYNDRFVDYQIVGKCIETVRRLWLNAIGENALNYHQLLSRQITHTVDYF
jgi:hypothetical protein